MLPMTLKISKWFEQIPQRTETRFDHNLRFRDEVLE